MTFFNSFSFIAMLAIVIGLSALGIDAVLPAFPQISAQFALVGQDANRIQQMVYTFMIGFALMQLFFGIMADIFGRKKILLLGLFVYVVTSAWILFIDSFDHLLLARFFQGAGLAAPRVLSQAIVRDVASGRAMSRIMSLIMTVFMLIPLLAPTIGQFAISIGNWHTIFLVFVALGLVIMFWVAIQLPETLPREKRKPLDIGHTWAAFTRSFTHLPTFLYMIILGMVFAMLMIYVGQAEQIYGREVYHLGAIFPLAFAATASGMLFASFLNARIVMRIGMRVIVSRSLFLMLIVDTGLLLCSLAHGGIPPLWLFMPFLILHGFFQSIVLPNLSSLTLEPHGQIAGTVSAVIGTIMTVSGVVIAQLVAAQFNGNVYPLVVGWFTLAALANLVNWTVNRVRSTTESS